MVMPVKKSLRGIFEKEMMVEEEVKATTGGRVEYSDGIPQIIGWVSSY